MNNFTDDLIVKSISASQWQLMDPFFYYFDESDKTKGVTVPPGFITDFASTPRIIWSIIPPTGRYTKAAALHDYLYSTPYKPTKTVIINKDRSILRYFTRKECDKIFLNAMKILGVGKWERTAMYFGVRLFGASHFKK